MPDFWLGWVCIICCKFKVQCTLTWTTIKFPLELILRLNSLKVSIKWTDNVELITHITQFSLLKINILLSSCLMNDSHLYAVNHCQGNSFINCSHILRETVQYLSWKKAADMNIHGSVMRTLGNTIYLFIYIILTVPLKSDHTIGWTWIINWEG
jgi:hypothetical protein